jgi:transposase
VDKTYIKVRGQWRYLSEVAAIVRESGETIRRWVHGYKANGLSDAPRSGKPVKTGATYRTRLVELVRRRPHALDLPFSMWTAARLADSLAEEAGLRMSVASIHRLLRSPGLGFSRPRHTISSLDPDFPSRTKYKSGAAETLLRPAAEFATDPTRAAPELRGLPWAGRSDQQRLRARPAPSGGLAQGDEWLPGDVGSKGRGRPAHRRRHRCAQDQGNALHYPARYHRSLIKRSYPTLQGRDACSANETPRGNYNHGQNVSVAC